MKKFQRAKEMLEVQGMDGNWDYDPYMHGLYNGMEYTLALLEGREPIFREPPEKWSKNDDIKKRCNAITGGTNFIEDNK